VVQLSDINKLFYDIINQEDWDDVVPNNDPVIYRDFISQQDVPLGNMILPTPIPGVWISISLGFEIENPGDYEKW